MAGSSVVTDNVVCVVPEGSVPLGEPLEIVGGVLSVVSAVAVTVKLKVEVLETPPPEAVMVTADVAAAAEADAFKVRVVEQVGEQEFGEKEAVTPLGRPEKE